MITVHQRWSAEKHRQEWVVFQGSTAVAVCPSEVSAQYTAQLIQRARDAWEAIDGLGL